MSGLRERSIRRFFGVGGTIRARIERSVLRNLRGIVDPTAMDAWTLLNSPEQWMG